MSSAPFVFVTRQLPEPGIELLLQAGYEVDVWPEDRPIDRAVLLNKVAQCDAVISMLTDSIDEEVLDHAPQLRVVANFAVGFNNIDVALARKRGIEVTTTPNVLTDATADLAFGLLLAAARRFTEGEQLVRSGNWDGWTPTQLLGRPVAGQTLGIVGMGAIGQAVARRAKGFGMSIVYHNRRRVDVAIEEELAARYVSLDELFSQSDFISLHAPLNDESRHLVNADSLAKMKETAIIVNTARGPLIDEVALSDALQKKRIFAAGLDVFAEEPIIEPQLMTLPNVVMMPHLGSATVTARRDMVELCCRNILAVLQNQPALTPAPAVN